MQMCDLPIFCSCYLIFIGQISLLTYKHVLQGVIWEERIRSVLSTLYVVFHKTLPEL